MEERRGVGGERREKKATSPRSPKQRQKVTRQRRHARSEAIDNTRRTDGARCTTAVNTTGQEGTTTEQNAKKRRFLEEKGAEAATAAQGPFLNATDTQGRHGHGQWLAHTCEQRAAVPRTARRTQRRKPLFSKATGQRPLPLSPVQPTAPYLSKDAHGAELVGGGRGHRHNGEKGNKLVHVEGVEYRQREKQVNGGSGGGASESPLSFLRPMFFPPPFPSFRPRAADPPHASAAPQPRAPAVPRTRARRRRTPAAAALSPDRFT